MYQYVDVVTISGFTITGSSGIGNAGIELLDSNYNIISNNKIISNKEYGIYLTDSTHNIITNNTFFHSDIFIVSWGLGDYNTIKGNNLSHKSGIFLIRSNDNIIENNHISNNGRGIGLYNNAGNIVQRNNFINNEIDIEAGIIGAHRYNDYNANYYDTWIGVRYNSPFFQLFPKILFRCLAIDWNPAKEPYDIDV